MDRKPENLLIVDDHPLFREGLKQVLSRLDDLHIVGEAGDGDTALTLIERLAPDWVLLDLALPGRDGFSVLEQARRNHPGIFFVILTSYDDRAYLERALALGARGFLVKDSATNDLLDCLTSIRSGNRYLSPSLGSRPPLISPPLPAEALTELTETERAILARVARFMTSKEIAEELGISHRTVQNHRANICAKLGLKGTHQLLAFARSHHPS